MFLFGWHSFTVICIPTLLRHLAEYFPHWQVWRLCKWNLFHFENRTLGFGVEATSSLGLLVSYPSSSSCLTGVEEASFPFPRRGLISSKRAREQARLGWDISRFVPFTWFWKWTPATQASSCLDDLNSYNTSVSLNPGLQTECSKLQYNFNKVPFSLIVCTVLHY